MHHSFETLSHKTHTCMNRFAYFWLKNLISALLCCALSCPALTCCAVLFSFTHCLASHAGVMLRLLSKHCWVWAECYSVIPRTCSMVDGPCKCLAGEVVHVISPMQCRKLASTSRKSILGVCFLQKCILRILVRMRRVVQRTSMRKAAHVSRRCFFWLSFLCRQARGHHFSGCKKREGMSLRNQSRQRYDSIPQATAENGSLNDTVGGDHFRSTTFVFP